MLAEVDQLDQEAARIGYLDGRLRILNLAAFECYDAADAQGAHSFNLRIVDVATFTVLLSVFAHGATAAVLSDRYVGWFDAHRSALPFESTEVDVGARHRVPRPSWFSSSSPDDR